MWRSYGFFFLEALGCAAWFFTAPFAAFYHMDKVDELSYMRPAWRFDRRRNQRVIVVEGEVVEPAPTATADVPEESSVVVLPKAD